MTKPLTQIDDEIREMTDDEFAIYQANLIVEQEREAAKIIKAEAKAALLLRLGITDDEAKLLLS